MTKILRKKILLATLLAAALIISSITVVYASKLSTPQGFQRVAVLMQAGEYKTTTPESVLVPWYEHTLMNWTDAQVAQQRQMAIDYFNTRFGLANTNPAFGVGPPEQNYRLYLMTGMNVPSEGWVVRDGSFSIILTEATVLHGTFGGSAGILVPAGTIFAWGYYNVLATPVGINGSFFETSCNGCTTIVVHFQSLNPMLPDPYGAGFVCTLVAPWGNGLAQGEFYYPTNATTGFTQADVRNVWTFPGFGPSSIQS